MANSVVLDAGPLVALLDRRDPWHEWTRSQLALLHEPLLTCEAVLSEAGFLLAGCDPGYRRMMALMHEGMVRIDFSLNQHRAAVAGLMAKYHDTPMSLADACLVRMSEQHEGARIFTLDSDFKFYRRHGRHAIPLLIPAS